jgi:hypothetical protein
VDKGLEPAVVFNSVRNHELDPSDPKPPINVWWKPDNEHYDALISPLTSLNSLFVRPIINVKDIVPHLDHNSDVRTIFENLFTDIDYPTANERRPALKAAYDIK